MNDLILAILFAVFVYIGYRGVKNNPDLLKADHLLKASGTLGGLALLLMAIVVFIIVLLRASG